MTTESSDKTILIQIRSGTRPITEQSVSEDFIRATKETLKDVSELAKNSIQSLITDINSMQVPPAEIEVEFGIDVGTEGGIPFITKGSLGANFKISFTWRRQGER